MLVIRYILLVTRYF